MFLKSINIFTIKNSLTNLLELKYYNQDHDNYILLNNNIIFNIKLELINLISNNYQIVISNPLFIHFSVYFVVYLYVLQLSNLFALLA